MACGCSHPSISTRRSQHRHAQSLQALSMTVKSARLSTATPNSYNSILLTKDPWWGKNELLQVIKPTEAEGAGDPPRLTSFLLHPQAGRAAPPAAGLAWFREPHSPSPGKVKFRTQRRTVTIWRRMRERLRSGGKFFPVSPPQPPEAQCPREP